MSSLLLATQHCLVPMYRCTDGMVLYGIHTDEYRTVDYSATVLFEVRSIRLHRSIP
jgi:hypothetical protein